MLITRFESITLESRVGSKEEKLKVLDDNLGIVLENQSLSLYTSNPADFKMVLQKVFTIWPLFFNIFLHIFFFFNSNQLYIHFKILKILTITEIR